jgi:uncharacterized protein Yka (UPF0111/DUF47 family)
LAVGIFSTLTGTMCYWILFLHTGFYYSPKKVVQANKISKKLKNALKRTITIEGDKLLGKLQAANRLHNKFHQIENETDDLKRSRAMKQIASSEMDSNDMMSPN